MPRFYFHLHNDIDVPDQEGADLPNLHAAREYAAEQIKGLAGETLKEAARLSLSHSISIEDERHQAVDTIHFRDVLKVED